MITVDITEKVDLDKALRIFKKICNKEGLFKELAQRQYYCKPSEKKRLKARRER